MKSQDYGWLNKDRTMAILVDTSALTKTSQMTPTTDVEIYVVNIC